MSPVPSDMGGYDELVVRGELVPAKRPLGMVFRSDPLPGKPGFSASVELDRLRDEERF